MIFNEVPKEYFLFLNKRSSLCELVQLSSLSRIRYRAALERYLGLKRVSDHDFHRMKDILISVLCIEDCMRVFIYPALLNGSSWSWEKEGPLADWRSVATLSRARLAYSVNMSHDTIVCAYIRSQMRMTNQRPTWCTFWIWIQNFTAFTGIL